MANVVGDVRINIEEGEEGNDIYVIQKRIDSIQADPNTGVISATPGTWQDVEIKE